MNHIIMMLIINQPVADDVVNTWYKQQGNTFPWTNFRAEFLETQGGVVIVMCDNTNNQMAAGFLWKDKDLCLVHNFP